MPEHDLYESLARRFNELQKVWKFGDYLVAKCGGELLFMNISKPYPTPELFKFDLGNKIEL